MPLPKIHIKKKKRLAILCVIVVLAIVIVAVRLSGSGNTDVILASTTLSRTTLSNTVSVKGVIQSTDSVNIYSNLNLPITHIAVKAGDRVQQGDLLCQMDTSDLELDIAAGQASLNAELNAINNQLEISNKNLNDAQDNLDRGLNGQIASAQNSIDTARDIYDNAKESVKDAQEDYDDAVDNRRDYRNRIAQYEGYLQDANKQYNAAVSAVSAAQTEYNNAKAAEEPDTELIDQLRDRLDSAKQNQQEIAEYIASIRAEINSMEASMDNQDAAIKAAERALENAKNDRHSAKTAYDYALHQMDIVENDINQDIEKLEMDKNSTENSKDTTSQQIALQKLQKQLSEATVTAPCSGVVTGVFVKEGSPANGVIFTIEDIDHLEAVVNVKEYNISSIHNGMKATIRTDATGNTIYDGEVTDVALTANKVSADDNNTSTTVEFATKISVKNPDELLRVGLNARVEIILEEKENVFSLPYESVGTDESGSSYIMQALPDGNGGYTAKKIPVETGLETDLYIEVISSELTEGMIILTVPDSAQEGTSILIDAAISPVLDSH